MQVIGGDLNTMAHGLARLAPIYANGGLRYKSFGWYEAEVWAHFIMRGACHRTANCAAR